MLFFCDTHRTLAQTVGRSFAPALMLHLTIFADIERLY